MVQGRLILKRNYGHKLEAAKYHLQRMKDTQSDPNPHIFEYELEAFLSAARSVTSLPEPRKLPDQWYLEKEFGHKPGFQQWYDQKVTEYAADSSMHFLNSERNISIHYNNQQIHTRSDAKLTFTDYVTVSDSISITTTHADGTTETFSSPSTPAPPERPSEFSLERIWYFDTSRMSGDKEVVSVREQHVRKLEKLLAGAGQL